MKRFLSILIAGGLLAGCVTPSAEPPMATIQFTLTASATLPPATKAAAPTATPSFTPQPILTPTQAAEEVNPYTLIGSPYAYSERSISESQELYAIKALDYLYQHPNTPYHFQIIKSVLDAVAVGVEGDWLDLEWLRNEWLDEVIRKPFEAAGGLPTGFPERWRKNGEITSADLDNNGEPDYVFTVLFGNSDLDLSGSKGVFWLHRDKGRFVIQPIEIALFAYSIHLEQIQDLNADGQPDLAYIVESCTVHNCFQRLRIKTYQDENWTDIPILPSEWWTTNGDWQIRQDDNEKSVELIATNTGPVDFDPIYTVDYAVHFQFQDGAYVPVRLTVGERNEPIHRIEWAKILADNQQFQESLDYLQNTPTLKAFEIDYEPYIQFRIGMTQLFLRDTNAAQLTWQSTITNYPLHLVSQTLTELLPLVSKPNNVWNICGWLKKNRPDWGPYVPSVNTDRAGGVKGLPGWYNGALVWQSYCDTRLLVRWQTWSNQEPLETQLDHLGLKWNTLSNQFDLNGDQIPDPILTIDNVPWAFLTAYNSYSPLLVTQTLPLNAVHFWEFECCSEGGNLVYHASPGTAPNRLVISTQLDAVRYHYEWTGERFDRQILEPSQSTDSDVVTLRDALDTLFHLRDPQKALESLDGFESKDVWQQAATHYLRGLAHEYLGETDAARSEYQTVLSKYSDTGWAILAQEKLK